MARSGKRLVDAGKIGFGGVFKSSSRTYNGSSKTLADMQLSQLDRITTAEVKKDWPVKSCTSNMSYWIFLMDFEAKSAEQILSWAITTYGERFAIVTSFQSEGVVLIDMALRLSPSIRVITLDTGRLPAETHQIINTIKSRYGIHTEIVHPDPGEVSSMVERYGRDLFYSEPAMRKLCCEIRKVRPLNRKLSELDAYAVGLRRSQSEWREHAAKGEQIEGRWKLSPVADWTHEDVWRYVEEHNVPINPLYAQGYRSIGCAPCTRAVQPGEDERAGRWWWEQSGEPKECGIHLTPDGRIRRTLDVMLSEVIAG